MAFSEELNFNGSVNCESEKCNSNKPTLITNHNKITQLIVQTELLSTHQFWQFDNVWKLEKIFDIQIFETHIDEMSKAY